MGCSSGAGPVRAGASGPGCPQAGTSLPRGMDALRAQAPGLSWGAGTGSPPRRRSDPRRGPPPGPCGLGLARWHPRRGAAARGVLRSSLATVTARHPGTLRCLYMQTQQQQVTRPTFADGPFEPNVGIGVGSPDHHHMGLKDWKTILRISSFSRANSSFCSSVQPGTTGSGQLHPARTLSGDPELPTYVPGGCPTTVVVCCMHIHRSTAQARVCCRPSTLCGRSARCSRTPTSPLRVP